MSSESDPTSDYLLLGSTPRPSTGQELDAMLEAVLARMGVESGGMMTGLEAATVQSTLDGADIVTLALDLTGVRVTNTGTPSSTSTLDDFGAVVEREEGVIREFRVRANPLVVQGVDVVLDGSVDDLKFVWAVDDQSRLGIGESEKELGRLRIQLHAETSQDALVAAATELLQEQVAEAGVTVSDLDVELASTGQRSATVVATAKIRKGILGASANFEAKATIDDAMVLHVTEPQLSSRNPLVAALLLVTRERINAAVATPIDLNASLPASLHLRDVTFDFGERIRVDLTFG